MTKKDDYLFQSGKVDNHMLQLESSSIWRNILSTPDLDEDSRRIIQNFFMPFQMSLVKFQLNYGYIQNTDYHLDHFDHEIYKQEHNHVAPTLRLIYREYLDIPNGYPTMFIACFPDVVQWAMKGVGLELIKLLIAERYPTNYISGNFLTEDVLCEIVNLYLKTTGKELECGILRG